MRQVLGSEMNPVSKLQMLRSKQPQTRYVRVESIKEGQVIVSELVDRQHVSLLIAKKNVTRRTLVLVRMPFEVCVTDIGDVLLGGGQCPPPHIEH